MVTTALLALDVLVWIKTKAPKEKLLKEHSMGDILLKYKAQSVPVEIAGEISSGET